MYLHNTICKPGHLCSTTVINLEWYIDIHLAVSKYCPSCSLLLHWSILQFQLFVQPYFRAWCCGKNGVRTVCSYYGGRAWGKCSNNLGSCYAFHIYILISVLHSGTDLSNYQFQLFHSFRAINQLYRTITRLYLYIKSCLFVICMRVFCWVLRYQVSSVLRGLLKAATAWWILVAWRKGLF